MGLGHPQLVVQHIIPWW